MNPQLLQNKPDKNNLVCVFWSAYAYIFAEHIFGLELLGHVLCICSALVGRSASFPKCLCQLHYHLQ